MYKCCAVFSVVLRRCESESGVTETSGDTNTEKSQFIKYSKHHMPRVSKQYECRYCQLPFCTRSGRYKHEQKHSRDNHNSNVTQCAVRDSFDGQSNMMDSEHDNMMNDSYEMFGGQSMTDDIMTTTSMNHTKIQNELLDKFLKHAMVSETQHKVPRTSIDETFRLIYESIKSIATNFDAETEANIVNCIPNISILLNDKKRDEEIARRFFECHPEEATYADQKIYYLPLKGLLAALFNKKKNLDWIDLAADRASEPGIYNDICDGSVVRESHFFQKYKDALQFILYLDECYLKDRTEYMMIYCTLGNFPTYTRCQLHNILPMAAIPTKLIKSAGDGVLQPILSQFIPFASDGVDIKIYNNGYRRFRGQVVVALLDHKAAHELGGFSTSFSNMKRFCRHCFLHRNDIGSTDQTKFILRTPEIHDRIVEAIEGGCNVEGLKSMYGVQKYSVLSDVPFFHVITKLPPDLMHTEFEGELKRELCFLLRHGVSDGWFTIDQFNNALMTWRQLLDLKSFVPPDVSDKFYNNPSSNELTAGQVYSLSTLMPFICTQLTAWSDIKDSIQFRSLMKHLEYLQITLQWSFTDSDLTKLDQLLKAHMDLWAKAYPDSFCPKSHYRLHYVEAIRAFGPLVGIYCMRYEAKHQLMKRLLTNTNNRNDAKTILYKALKHMATMDQLNDNDLVLKDSISLTDQLKARVCSDCARSPTTSIKSFRTASYKNITFRVGDLITTTDGYALLDAIYQFNDDIESIVCRVKLLKSFDATPVIAYPQISKSQVLRDIYIPVTNVRGRIYTINVDNQAKCMVVYTSSMLILNDE